MTIDVKDAAGVTRSLETPNPNGRAAAAASRPVTLATEDLAALTGAQGAGENHLGKVGGESAVVSASFARPADSAAYAVGDLVANSTSAANVQPLQLALARVNGGTGCLRRVRLSTTHVGLGGSDVFRIHFFKAPPTPVNGDNGVFSVNGVGAVHLGYADVTLDRVFSDGAKGIGVPAAGSEIVFDAAPGSTLIYALAEARSAYAPASGETLTVAAEVLRD